MLLSTQYVQMLQLRENRPEKDALRKYLLANANIQKDQQFNSFKEKTTVKINRDFNSACE